MVGKELLCVLIQITLYVILFVAGRQFECSLSGYRRSNATASMA